MKTRLQTLIPVVLARANMVGSGRKRTKGQIDLLEEIQCNHCRPSLNYPKGIASRCQPSQQFENWCLLGDNCLGYGCGGAEGIRPWMRLCSELGIRCASLYDGDKTAEFEAAVNEFAANDSLKPFLLNRPDIRDKYERDKASKETTALHTKGVFQRGSRDTR